MDSTPYVFSLPDGVFLPFCDHGLDFLYQLIIIDVCMMATHIIIARKWIDRVRLPILLVVS